MEGLHCFLWIFRGLHFLNQLFNLIVTSSNVYCINPSYCTQYSKSFSFPIYMVEM